jgi:hypothetical protein
MAGGFNASRFFERRALGELFHDARAHFSLLNWNAFLMRRPTQYGNPRTRGGLLYWLLNHFLCPTETPSGYSSASWRDEKIFVPLHFAG